MRIVISELDCFITTNIERRGVFHDSLSIAHDTPTQAATEEINKLLRCVNYVVFLTFRSERLYEATLIWLQTHGLWVEERTELVTNTVFPTHVSSSQDIENYHLWVTAYVNEALKIFEEVHVVNKPYVLARLIDAVDETWAGRLFVYQSVREARYELCRRFEQ